MTSISKDNLKNDHMPWIVETETISGVKETNEFDFVVIATGAFSEPYVPIYRGQNNFAGPILPPCAIKTYQQIEEKRVIIVGFGKSAMDMAVLAGHYARSCYLVFREAHWIIPRRIVKGLLPVRLLNTRAFSMPFAPLPGAPSSRLFRFLHEKFPELFTTMIDEMSNDIKSIHRCDLFNDRIFIPQRLLQNSANISIISDDFIRFKCEGRIIGKLGTIDEIIDEATVRLKSGEELQADIIISATGHIQRFPFFTQTHAQMMGLITVDKGVEFNLYRRIVPVGIPNIAFTGFAISINQWMIAEAASHWISDYFLKRLQLPDSEDEMHEEIKTHNTFIKKIFNRRPHEYRYYWIAPIEIYLNDMGLTLHRTSNWISEYFGIYRPERLKGIHDEREIIAKTGHRPRRFYLSFTMTIFIIVFLIFINSFLLK